MARTHFQKLGVWFPRAGKVASFSGYTFPYTRGIDELSFTPLYLWATPFMGEGERTAEFLNEDYPNNYVPNDGQGTGAFLVRKISKEDWPNTVGDIMEGFAFYLTDQEDGTAPSEEALETEAGCYITWSE